jgi:hypothetical protein
MTLDISHRASEHAGQAASGRQGARIVLFGAGNIGSHVADKLGDGAESVASLCIVDRGFVEAHNTRNQRYEARHVGSPKAEVAAESLRRRLPHARIEAIVASVEDVPLGMIRAADVFLGALDSLRARQVLANDLAYRCGIPLVDGAVDGEDGWYGTVQVLLSNAACIECKWGEAHYRQLAGEMPCGLAGHESAPPNQASAPLGAAVAQQMIEEAMRVAADPCLPHSYEIALDVQQGRRLVSRLSPARCCRFDHRVARERVALGRPFAEAGVHDLRRAALDWAGGERAQLEFRRAALGTGMLAPLRWQSPASLVRFAARPLSEVGLTADDWIWMQTPSRSAFLELVADVHPRRGG